MEQKSCKRKLGEGVTIAPDLEGQLGNILGQHFGALFGQGGGGK